MTNDVLTASLLTAPSHGELVLETDGSFNYSPDSNFNGTDSFVYEVTDGNSGTATATATITITPVNDDPVANDDTKTTPEDNPITINVLSNDADVDGDTLSILTVEQPTNGAAIINANNTLTYYTNDLVGEGATRADTDSILNYLNEVGDSLFDIDGNGSVELQDYNLIDLFAGGLDEFEFGFLLENFPNDLIGEGATRTDAASILAHFEAIVP